MSRYSTLVLFVSMASSVWAQDVATPVSMPTMTSEPDVVDVAVSFHAADGGLYEQIGLGGHAFEVSVVGGSRSGSDMLLYGDASYKRELKRDVKWNETADFFWVYPYLTADSVGGSLKCEGYSFHGGFVRSHNSFSWGAHAAYRAGLQYRSIDPRPRNITSDLCVSLGMSVAPSWSGGWALHLSADARKYKQDNELKFYSELGHDKVFHLLGLGQHYVRFAGVNLSSFYDGSRWGLSLGADCGNDRMCQVGLYSYRLQKVLDLNNDLPLCTLSERGGSLSLEWLGWSLSGQISNRLGSEEIYGDVVGGDSYHLIASHRQYELRRGEISCGLDRNLRNDFFRICGEVGYSSHNETYAMPFQQMKVRKISESILFGVSPQGSGGRWQNSFTASLSHDWSLASSLLLPMASGRDGVLDSLVQRNFIGLRDPGVEVAATADLRLRVGKGNDALRAQISYAYDFMTEFHSCSVALSFVKMKM